MRQASVLIVDEDPQVRTDLRSLVTGMGHVVVGEAGISAQALSLTRSLRPSIVLLGMVLPSLPGWDVVKSIAAERISPVVLVTTGDDAEGLENVDAAGVMAYLASPLRAADLRGTIPVALARFRERTALEDEVKSLNERMEARKLVGRAKAILMERQGLTEREAFRRIQSQSVTLNKPVHEIARAIITASEISVEGPGLTRTASSGTNAGGTGGTGGTGNTAATVNGTISGTSGGTLG